MADKKAKPSSFLSVLERSKSLEKPKAKGVYIRPLFTDQGPDEMAKNLFRMLYCIGVKCTDICQITVSKYEGVASVHVRTAECERYLMTIFQDPAIIMNQYDLRRITKDPQKLTVTRFLPQSQSGRHTPAPLDSDVKPHSSTRNLKAEKHLHQASTGPRDDAVVERPMVIPSGSKIDRSEIEKGSLSSSTSLSYSQCGFEQLVNEQEIPREIECFKEVATSTSDFKMPVKRKDQRNGKRKLEDVMTNGSRAGIEKDIEVRKSGIYRDSSAINSRPSTLLEAGSNQRIIDQGISGSLNPRNSKTQKVDSLQQHKSNTSIKTKSTKPQHLSSSRHSLPKPPKSHTMPSNTKSPQNVIKLHAKTSTPAMPSCGCPETVFYHLQQHIGAETRYTEFKRGGVVREQDAFRFMVGKYMCGFLNSEGGTLYFGVNDDGKVLGISVDAAMEETLREDVDFAVRSLLDPSVDPSEYSVNFARVMKASGQLSQDLRVMEVCVKPRRPPEHNLFSCDNIVYIRRDGSLQAITCSGPSGRRGFPGHKLI